MQVDNSLEMLAQKNREVCRRLNWPPASALPLLPSVIVRHCAGVLNSPTTTFALQRKRKREQSFDNENDQGAADETAAAARPRKNIKSQGFKYDQ